MRMPTRLKNLLAAIRVSSRLPGGAQNWDASWMASAGYSPRRTDDIPTPDQALGISGVYAAVSLLTGTLSATEIQLTRRAVSGGALQIHGGSIPLALSEWQFEDQEAGLFDAFTSGNGFWRKHRFQTGAVSRLEWGSLRGAWLSWYPTRAWSLTRSPRTATSPSLPSPCPPRTSSTNGFVSTVAIGTWG